MRFLSLVRKQQADIKLLMEAKVIAILRGKKNSEATIERGKAVVIIFGASLLFHALQCFTFVSKMRLLRELCVSKQVVG